VADVRVLVLTVRRDETFIEAALRAGADGYVLRRSRAELFKRRSPDRCRQELHSPSALDRMVTPTPRPRIAARALARVGCLDQP